MADHYRKKFCATHGYRAKQVLRSALHRSRAEYKVVPEVLLVNAVEPGECPAPECDAKATLTVIVRDGSRMDGAPIEVEIS